MSDDHILERALTHPDRLRALRETKLLDSAAEACFDRLTHMAASLVGAPATFLSLVDAERDFYKSHCGFGEPLATTRQLEGRTFCHYALVHDGPLIIEDTTADPVYREVPTVSSLGVRAYVGVPITLPSGHTLGSFCAIDFAPRRWSPEDIDIMRELALACGREIALRAALDEARAATRARERMLAVVAHDLRGPLTVVRTTTALLGERLGETDADVLAIRDATDGMQAMVGDLLDAARWQEGAVRLRTTPLDPVQLIEDAASTLGVLARASGSALLVESEPGLPTVSADYRYVLRVFANLVSNALKHGKAGAPVRLRATAGEGTVAFSVADRGPGLPEHASGDLFKAFWRGDAHNPDSIGLGLHIVREIVHAHGGDVSATSTPGVGSTFRFELPVC